MIDMLWLWGEMLVRWLHVIAGIAWIGSSFYFIALDLSLKPGKGLPDEAHGQAWQVHGGGFYNMVKYLVAPARMPAELTWFKWEAYATWLSGAVLMVLVYYLGAELYLVDYNRLDAQPWQGVAISVAGIGLGWALYDGLCRSPLGNDDRLLALAGLCLLTLLAYGYSLLFSDRGAFMQMGVTIGTIMVANVLMVIIPGQKKVVASLLAGEQPDPRHGRRGKQRSLHNNYLTLPVVYVMLGGHYPMLYATDHAWLMFALVLVIGAVIRQYFNTKHRGEPAPLWYWGVAGLLMVVVIWLGFAGAPQQHQQQAMPADGEHGLDAAAVELVQERCALCHAAEPAWDGMAIAPKGVRLETEAEIIAQARQIAAQAAWSRAMPPAGVMELSSDERLLLRRWAERL